MTGMKTRSHLVRLSAARHALSECLAATRRYRGTESIAVRADCIARLVSLQLAVISIERIAVGTVPRQKGNCERQISRLINTVDRAVERTYRRLENLPQVVTAAGRIADSIGQERGA